MEQLLFSTFSARVSWSRRLEALGALVRAPRVCVALCVTVTAAVCVSECVCGSGPPPPAVPPTPARSPSRL